MSRPTICQARLDIANRFVVFYKNKMPILVRGKWEVIEIKVKKGGGSLPFRNLRPDDLGVLSGVKLHQPLLSVNGPTIR